MILTIDEVKNTRFRMATRRSGYEASDVDIFVDKVEATLIEMTEERDTLKRQLEVLAAVPDSDESQALQEQLAAKEAEINELREQLAAAPDEAPTAEWAASNEELEQLREELQSKDAMIASLSSGGDEVVALREDLDAKSTEINSLQEQIRHLRDAAASARTGDAEHLVVSTASDAAPAVTRLLQMATEQSEQLVAEAKAESERLIGEAQKESHELVADARQRAEQIESDARSNAEQVENDARSRAEQVTNEANERADQVNRDAAARREEVFSTLEEEREKFAQQVDHLRGFESRFRETFTANLEDYLGKLRDGSIEPDDVPELMDDQERHGSATPRLDALLSKGQDV